MNGGAPTSLSVCVRDHVACVRVTGRANFTSSVDFRKLLQQLRDDGCTEIVLDLTECALMDSTFLGVLASAACKCEASRHNGHGCIIELYHPTERVLELLDNLGVLNLFKILNDVPQLGAYKRVNPSDSTRTDLNRTCFEAHQALMKTSEENARRFKDATDFFEKNLREDEGKE